MKIAALSDIHGNLAALDAVLADIRRRGADVIVNLGDIVSGALHPAETADRLIALDLPTIKGNHERQLLSGDRESLRLSDRWARDTLRDAHLAWIAALPPRLMLDDDVLMVHGTPASDLAYFLETVTPDGCRAATPDEIAQRAGNETASLILCGHTHVPRAATLEDGRLIVNPGSVGLQAYADDHPHPHPHRIENGTPHARYAMVSRTAAGWHAEFHAVDYDWDTAAATAAARGRDDWTVALRTGRC
ncbi:metallophosphoesterase family protein [Burkholderia multivorans]|uniref:metallophosphoesterase family protein n=1 Tax=Burkholderia multivorans TaxID=87883 RepID=UPI0012DD13AB|nr:metallophosphoesterase family protein [Burkholderia multivorans]MBU9342787.1 metallophosphatase family protein [Burkholderia multivorans]MCA8139255.1 metallophosphatase family protein [Burkholderia multivorans]MCO1363313.1 metallophosphatase family protein [Burkholderia multivorans]MCO1379646.1 metallophosphatase family protein [Burkholderia multivorans]QGR63129.1 metallophosphoesterase [Burkholderia multivorans]